MQDLLSVENLSLKLGDRRILSSVSFTLERGDFAVLCGRNGAGKSQLLRALKGLIQPDSGIIVLDGVDLTKNRRERLKRMALVFQDAQLQFVGETVEKDIAFGPLNLGWSREEVESVREEVIAVMELDKVRRQRPASLSGGEKRRLTIAGVLAMRPDIIFLDEPFSALDYPSTRLVLSSLVRLHQEGHTILVVSHEVEKFLRHTTKVLIMNSGHMCGQYRPEESLDELRRADVYVPSLPLEDFSWLQA